eukprot:scaffold172365_cov45-Tisochrysis_lutea.AAC.1
MWKNSLRTLRVNGPEKTWGRGSQADSDSLAEESHRFIAPAALNDFCSREVPVYPYRSLGVGSVVVQGENRP